MVKKLGCTGMVKVSNEAVLFGFVSKISFFFVKCEMQETFSVSSLNQSTVHLKQLSIVIQLNNRNVFGISKKILI